MKSKSPLMLSHYVGHALGRAKIELGKGKKNEAEMARLELITQLEGLNEDPPVRGCINYLRNTDWSNYGNIDAFQKKYKKLNPREQQMDEVLSQLNKQRGIVT